MEKMKIVRTMGNKEAMKIFFMTEKKKEKVWERRKKLRAEDMTIDKWLNCEERNERYAVCEKIRVERKV